MGDPKEPKGLLGLISDEDISRAIAAAGGHVAPATTGVADAPTSQASPTKQPKSLDDLFQGYLDTKVKPGGLPTPGPGQSQYEATQTASYLPASRRPGADLQLKDPGASQGGGTNLGGLNDMMSGMGAGVEVENQLRNHTLSRGQGDGKVVMPEGHDYLTLGEDGKDSFKRAFVDAPDKLQSAVDQSERATEQKNTALASHYDQELNRSQSAMSAMQAKRQKNEEQVTQRVQNLDQATQFYSNDLADRNKFWQSPGNIVSAIAFSLMPIFSNDPAIGVKLINQAIDKDMADRKDLANMHLGELRSNLGNYRKMAEDQTAGDMLAEAEARRIAAMQVDKIAANFESPISKAKAEAIKADLLMKHEMLKQQAFNHYVYNAPKLVDSRIAKGYAKTADGHMSPFDELEQRAAASLKPGAMVQGSIAGTPSVASTTGKTVNITPQQAQAYSSPGIVKDIVEKRIPDGQEAITAAQRAIAVRASYMAHGDMTPGNPAFEHAKDVIVDKGMEDLKVYAQPLAKIAQSRNGIARLQEDMDIIQKSVKDPNAFIGSMRNVSPDAFSSWYSNISSKWASDPSNAAQARSQRLEAAAARFHQLAMGNIVEYYHSQAGANQSPGEEGRLGQIIRSDYSWNQLHGFVNNRSSAIRAEEATLLNTMPTEAALVYMARMGVQGHNTGIVTGGMPGPRPAKPVPPPANGARNYVEAPLGPTE